MPLDEFSLLDEDEFDVVKQINKLFPDEQSLSSIEDYIATIESTIKEHDDEISMAVRDQSVIQADGHEELNKATAIISELRQRIFDMKSQAKKSEQTVNEITCDIKQLDNAKRNLTSAVTMLNNLHILVESVEKLKEIYDKNEYRQAASILAGTQDVLKQFENHKHIPQIKHLSSEIDILCASLREKINIDFKRLFEVPSKSSLSKEDNKLIAEACLVMSLLGDDIREDLINWFLELQLTEYDALFKDIQLHLSSLNGVDKRFAWLKKHLLQFEERYGFLFPPPWEMSERMAVMFCSKTKTSLSRVLSNHPNEIKLDALMYAVNKTSAFETLLSKRFSGATLTSEQTSNRVHPFDGLITSCLEPYFHVFVAAQESATQKLFDTFIEDHAKQMKTMTKTDPSRVFSSSNQLFQQYKSSLVQCVQFTNKSALADLHEVFKRYLREYIERVLKIPLKSSKTTTDSSGKTTTKMFSVGSTGLFQSLLRDDGKSKFEVNYICSVILTADYCLETTQQLEKKLKERIDQNLVSKIDLKPELDLFNELINGCIQLLIINIESGCEPGFTTMIKTNWSNMETPVGHSQFVNDITNSLQTQIPIIRNHLKDARKYFVQLCNKFITLFTHNYTTNLFRCKLLSQGGAEQLLLDTQTLKKSLINLPCHDSDIKQAPVSYTKAANKGMSKAEMVLQVVMVPHSPSEEFIESYFKLLPDSNACEFQRILDIKGVRKNEASQLLEAYNKAASEIL